MDLELEICKARKNKDWDLFDKLMREKADEELIETIHSIQDKSRKEVFTSMIEDFARMERWINDLREELKQVKSDAYKDEELSKIKTELDEARADLRRGFGISEKENNAINNWINEHEKVHSGGHGVSGGKYSYHFIPTGIGTIGTIRCSCGEEFDFQELG